MTTTRTWLWLWMGLLTGVAIAACGAVPFPLVSRMSPEPPDTNQVHLMVKIQPVTGAASYQLTVFDNHPITNLFKVIDSMIYTNWSSNAPYTFMAATISSNGVVGSNSPIVVWPFRFHVWEFCVATNLTGASWVPFTSQSVLIFTNNTPTNWPKERYWSWRNVTNF